MKKLLLIPVVLVGLVAALIGVVFYASSGLTTAANAFFAAAKSGNYQAAYAMGSEAFKKSTTEAQLTDFLQTSHFDTFENVSWSNRSVEVGKGTLSGSVTTKAGGTFPVTLQFVKEGSDWRILSLDKAQAGVSEDKNVTPPTQKEAEALVKESMKVFASSIKAGDMTPLYQHISSPFREQTSVEKLNEAFASFITQKIDLTSLDGLNPLLSSPPVVDENGTVKVDGYYPTEPSRVGFAFKYIHEGLSWKLVDVNVSVRPVKEADDSEDEESTEE